MSTLYKNKTALITGATRGLGFHLAKKLAANGAHIIALGRTVGALEELDDQIKSLGSEATLVPIDLMDTEKLQALGPTLYQKFKTLDLFIGNAAYLGGLAPIDHFKTAEWNKILSTNLVSNFTLIQTLTPLLRQANQSTAIFITDQNPETRDSAYWGPYMASKSGLEALVKSFAAEQETTSLTVSLVDPGPMSTDLRRKAYPGEEKNAAQDPANISEKIVALLKDNKLKNGELHQL